MNFPQNLWILSDLQGLSEKLGEYIQIQWINMKTSSTHSFSQWNPMAGWWLTYPSQKYDESSVGMMTFPTEWTVIKLHGSKPPTRWLFMAIPCSTPFLVLETGRPVPVLDILDARAQDGDLRMIQPSFSWKIGKTNGNKTG
jgi:hypothetical protein